jgi:putative redox protein
MNATVKWHQRLTFTGTADTGFTVPLGGSPGVGGDDDGFRPMELIAVGLAGCTAMDTISILQKKRQEVTEFEVHVHAEREEGHPRVFTHIKINYQVTGHSIDENALRRAIMLSVERYCPAQAMLGQVVPIDHEYQIFEAGENGEHELVASGDYQQVNKKVNS